MEDQINLQSTDSSHNFVLFLFFYCSLINVQLLERKYYSGDQIKRNEMGRACGMYRGVARCVQGCGEET